MNNANVLNPNNADNNLSLFNKEQFNLDQYKHKLDYNDSVRLAKDDSKRNFMEFMNGSMTCRNEPAHLKNKSKSEIQRWAEQQMLLCEQPTIDLIQTIFQNSGMSGTTENKDKVTQDGKDLLRDCLTEFILFISEDAGNNAKNRVSNEATEKGKIRTNTDLMLKNNKILDSLPQSITNLKFTESQIARLIHIVGDSYLI